MKAAVLVGARLAQKRLDVIPTLGLAAAYDLTRVNLLNYSEDFSQATWSKNPNAAVTGSPGNQTVTNTVANYASMFQEIKNLTPGQAVTFSWLGTIVSGTVGYRIYFPDITTDYGSPVIPWPAPDANGVRSVTFTLPAGAIRAYFYPFSAGVAASATYSWAQVNTGHLASYQKTLDAQTVVDSSVKGVNVLPTDDLTAASWIKQQVTVAASGTLANGSRVHKLTFPDGTSQSPYVIGPSAADAASLTQRTVRLMARRLSGVGSVRFRAGAGVADTAIALTSNWQEFTVTQDGGTARYFIVSRAGTIGVDEIEVAELQLNMGGYLAYEHPPLNAVLGTTSAVEATDPAVTPAGLVFDGVDDKVLGPVLPTVSDSGLTYVAVVTIPQAGTSMTIMDNKTQGSNNAGMSLEIATAGDALVRVANGSAQTQTRGGTGRITTGKPILLVGVVDRVGGQTRLYLGAELLATGVFNTAWNINSTQPLYLGNYGNGAAFNGTLHFSDVINRALSTQEVGQLYRALKKRLAPRGVALS